MVTNDSIVEDTLRTSAGAAAVVTQYRDSTLSVGSSMAKGQSDMPQIGHYAPEHAVHVQLCKVPVTMKTCAALMHSVAGQGFVFNPGHLDPDVSWKGNKEGENGTSHERA